MNINLINKNIILYIQKFKFFTNIHLKAFINMENKDNDTVEKMKGFFSSAFTATKEASVKAYDKTSEFASDTYKKAD